MNADAVKGALEALGRVLGITAAVDGATIKASVVPDISTLDLKNFSPDGLSTPILAPLRVAGAGKNVGFPTGQIVDGDPTDSATRLVADPLPDAADLSAPGAVAESPLQAVLGLLGGLEGTIPVGAFTPDFVTVTATICWHVDVDDRTGGRLPLTTSESSRRAFVGHHSPIREVPGGERVAHDGDRHCAAITSTSEVEIPVVPPIVPLRGSQEPVEVAYRVTADVTLRALGVEHTEQVGPVDVAVPAIEIPTVLVVFSEVRYNTSKDGGRLVIVPGDVPAQQLQTLADRLNAASSALAPLTGFARLVGLLVGVRNVLDALRPVPAGSKHKLIFASLDETRDLGKVAPDWRHRRWWDDHGAEDDIGSLLMLSVDQGVDLWEHQNFNGPEVNVDPSASQFWVGIPDFHDMTTFLPADADVASDKDNFNDKAHSLKFRPRPNA